MSNPKTIKEIEEKFISKFIKELVYHVENNTGGTIFSGVIRKNFRYSIDFIFEEIIKKVELLRKDEQIFNSDETKCSFNYENIALNEGLNKVIKILSELREGSK